MNNISNLIVRENCPVCGQGSLLIGCVKNSNKLFVVCDDCESEWSDPRSALAGEQPTRDKYQGRYATKDDINKHPWRHYVLNL